MRRGHLPTLGLACLLGVLLMPVAARAWDDVAEVHSADSRLGAHVTPDGLAFGLYAPDATRVDLLLFDQPDATTPRQAVPMRRDGDIWRIGIRGEAARTGLHYLYQVAGPRTVSPADRYGDLFNDQQRLGDPYACLTQNVRFAQLFAATPFIDIATPIYAGGGKSIVYDHTADAPAGHVAIAAQDLVLYELHVQDYTSLLDGLPASERGTYLGLTRPGLTNPAGRKAGINHLVELGVNAVELMPVMEYDEDTGTAAGRLNHWRFMTTNFLAPEARSASAPGAQVTELKQLIHALHARGIAVFMDVVFN